VTFAAHLPGYKLYDALKDSAFEWACALDYACLPCLRRGSSWQTGSRCSIASQWSEYCRGRGDDLAGCPADSPIHSPPGSLLGSGLTAWAIFSFLYRVICLFLKGFRRARRVAGFCGRDGAVPDCGERSRGSLVSCGACARHILGRARIIN